MLGNRKSMKSIIVFTKIVMGVYRFCFFKLMDKLNGFKFGIICYNNYVDIG
jgi:hypothetical protein